MRFRKMRSAYAKMRNYGLRTYRKVRRRSKKSNTSMILLIAAGVGAYLWFNKKQN